MGIYATNAPDVVSYISSHAPLDVLVMGDAAELERILDGREAKKAFPDVKVWNFTWIFFLKKWRLYIDEFCTDLPRRSC